MARTCLEVARAALVGRGSCRRGRHLQPARRRRSCGIARPACPIGPGTRLAGPAHGRRVPRAARRRRTRRAEPVGHQGAVAPRPARRPRPRPPTSASAPSTRGSRGHSRRRRARHRRDERGGHRAACTRDTSRWDAECSSCSAYPGDDAGDRRLDGDRRPRPPRSPGAPPIAALLGDQQASLVGQGCVHRGRRQDHVRDRRRCSISCSATAPPPFDARGTSTARSRSSPGGTPAHDDVRRRSGHARGGHERAVAPRRPRPRSRAATSRTSSPRRAPTPTASCSCPRPSVSARPPGTTARAARCSA